MKQIGSKGILPVAAGFLLSAVILTLIQVPFDIGWLAWVGLVPFIFVCSPGANPWRLVWLSYVISLCYWLGNLYWIGYVTVSGYVGFCIYMGLYWPLLALCVRYCRTKWGCGPLLLVIPLIFVGAEAWQGILITGFNWRLLGHSQYANIRLIQMADVLGVPGISFAVAMVNGLICGFVIDITKGKIFRAVNFVKAGIVFCLIIGALAYGQWRIAQSEEFLEAGPLVGSVQPNVPSNVKEVADNAAKILEDLLVPSKACMDAGAKLVIWPETMVLTTMNKSYLELCRPDSEPVRFHTIISEHAKDKSYVLFGAHAANMELDGTEYNTKEKFNSAFLYRPDGQQDAKRYDKIHLVPFGEYIPFKESANFIYKLFLKFSPYNYDYNLTRGTDYTSFEISSDNKTYRFGVLICYDDTDPKVTRKISVEKGRKKADWLVNISNDGWYVRYKDGKVLPSVELSQRTVITAFRAIENRISIIRSVNTGISCLIDSVGRIRDGFISGDLPVKAMDRQGLGGWFVDRITLDKRVTFFSKHGQWLGFCCAGVWVFVIISALRQNIRRRKSGGM